MPMKTKMVAKLRLSDPSSSETKASTSSESSSKIDSGEEEFCEEDEGEEESGGGEASGSEVKFQLEEDDENFCDVEESDESDYEEDSDISIRDSDEFVECQHRVYVDLDDMIKTYAKEDISDFVTRKTHHFFRRFQLPSSFLQKPTFST